MSPVLSRKDNKIEEMDLNGQEIGRAKCRIVYFWGLLSKLNSFTYNSPSYTRVRNRWFISNAFQLHYMFQANQEGVPFNTKLFFGGR